MNFGVGKRTGLLVGLIAAWAPSLAMAQEEAAAAGSNVNYLPAYIIVGLAVGLGIYLFTMNANRSETENLGPNVRVAAGFKAEDLHKEED